MEYLTVEIPVEQWHLIDGSVDNSMSTDVIDDNIETMINGACVRDAGWRAGAAYTGKLDQLGCPPLDYPLPIVLRRAHWEWTLEQLERWDEDGDTAELAELITSSIPTA